MWITNELFCLLEERRKMKNNEKRYKETQTQIRQKIRIEKEEWIKSQSHEI